MTLSALIKKGGLTSGMTVTVATGATVAGLSTSCVAGVATVTVAEQPEPFPELSPEEASNIRAWLAHIEETDPVIITEVLDKCRTNLKACRYFLKRSEEVPEPTGFNRSVHCGDCLHFERIDHPYLGHCAKGEPEAIAGLWDTDRRYCERFIPQPRSKP